MLGTLGPGELIGTARTRRNGESAESCGSAHAVIPSEARSASAREHVALERPDADVPAADIDPLTAP